MKIFPVRVTRPNEEVVEYEGIVIGNMAKVRRKGSARRKLIVLSEPDDESAVFAEIVNQVMDMEKK